MKASRLIIITTLALTLTAAPTDSYAQTLKKDITVEHETVIEHRDASRLPFTPDFTLPPVTNHAPAYNLDEVSATVPTGITRLEPVAYDDAIATSDWRGYAQIGYFPMLNAMGSLGYRLIDTRATRLSAWGQADLASHKYRSTTWRDNSATAALSLTQMTGARSWLEGTAGYTYRRYNQHMRTGIENQGSNRALLDVAWNTTSDELRARVEGAIEHFAYTTMPYALSDTKPKAPAQAMARLSVDLQAPLSTAASVSVALGINHIHETIGSLTAKKELIDNCDVMWGRPSFTTTFAGAQLRIGATISTTKYGTDRRWRVAPDVALTLKAAPVVRFELAATGGMHNNSLTDLQQAAPYVLTPNLLYTSNVPLDLKARLTLGSFSGLYIMLDAGYAKADDWLMPFSDIYHLSQWQPQTLKGWHAGASLIYSYSTLLEMKAAFATAPSSVDKGYYAWRDRAHYVASASLTVKPTDALRLRLDGEYRGKRWEWGVDTDNIVYGGSNYQKTDLGDVANINLNAQYAFTSQLSFFLTFNNLLNHHYTLPGNIPSMGLHGLVGVSYLF